VGGWKEKQMFNGDEPVPFWKSENVWSCALSGIVFLLVLFVLDKLLF
jgi:hypothetical protein